MKSTKFKMNTNKMEKKQPERKVTKLQALTEAVQEVGKYNFKSFDKIPLSKWYKKKATDFIDILKDFVDKVLIEASKQKKKKTKDAWDKWCSENY